LSNLFNFTAGLRFDYYNTIPNEFVTDISPRFSSKFLISSKTSIRAAYGHFYQFPGSEGLKQNSELNSNKCIHYIAGINHSFSPAIKGWFEVYYKDYIDLVIKDSLGIFSNTGTGFSRGAELFLAKQKGVLQGWISYALAWAERQQSLMDKMYYFEYDKRHMFNVALDLNIDNQGKWYVPISYIAQFRYESGNPYTPIESAVFVNNQWIPIKGDINSERNPAFHTLSLKIEWEMSKSDKIHVISFMEAWNLYNHKNVMGRVYSYGTEYTNNVKVEEYYSIPIMSSGGVRIMF